MVSVFFFLHNTSPPDIYTLSLHDALPIFSFESLQARGGIPVRRHIVDEGERVHWERQGRSEEHTSELQSRGHLVCRLLLEKKNPRNGLHGMDYPCVDRLFPCIWKLSLYHC